MTKILIARHGNTFDKGDTLLRVGKRTDLPLSSSGEEQARVLGQYLAKEHPVLDKIYTSNLKRTQQTAQIALSGMGLSSKVVALDVFDEIDYGPDEGKPEDEVVERIGSEALKKWDTDAIAPEGWLVDVNAIKEGWKNFVDGIKDFGGTIFVVTSNGTARFAPYILKDAEGFMKENNIKLSTGAVSCLSYENGQWTVEYWNRKPSMHFQG